MYCVAGESGAPRGVNRKRVCRRANHISYRLSRNIESVRLSGCKTSPRCDHAWWLDVMHHRKRYRMPVDDFAFPRGATAPITSKQEAEKMWEPKLIAEIA